MVNNGEKLPQKLKLTLVARIDNCNFSGVYLLVERESGEIVYVGQTRNIFARFQKHEYFDPNIHDVYIDRINITEKRAKQENYLIRLFSPKLNKKPYGMNFCGNCRKGFNNVLTNKRFCSNACKQEAYRKRKKIMSNTGLNSKAADEIIFFAGNYEHLLHLRHHAKEER